MRLSTFAVLVGSVSVDALRKARGRRGMLNDDPVSPWDPAMGTTVQGCTCTSLCASDKDENYMFDWCKVDRSCKGRKFSFFRGSYDFCAYTILEEFENQWWKAKESQVWWRIVANQSPAPHAKVWPAIRSAIEQMALRSIFENWRDVKPRGMAKVLHLQAVMCKFKMTVSRNSPYTGIFAPGETHGIMRMGSASFRGPFPGLSLKWFRTNTHSANIMMLRKEMQRNITENYFQDGLSNHVIPPEAFEMFLKFIQATDCQAQLALFDLGKYDQDGNNHSDNLKFPFEFLVEPRNQSLAPISPDREDYHMELLKQLSKIPVGTKIFDVKTVENPAETPVKIGEMETTTECAPSYFGDTRLAFKHWRMEDDYALRPDWIPRVVQDLCNPKAGWP